MTDPSLLNTPLTFELPCHFTNSTASLRLEAIAPTTEQSTLLFDIELDNLTNTPDLSKLSLSYKINPLSLEDKVKTRTTPYCYSQGNIFDQETHTEDVEVSFRLSENDISITAGEDYLATYKYENSVVTCQLKADYCLYSVKIKDFIYTAPTTGSTVIIAGGYISFSGGVVTFDASQ